MTLDRRVEERKSRLDVHRLAEGEIRPRRRRVQTGEETQAHQGRYDHRNLKQLHLRPSFLPEGNRHHGNRIDRSFCRKDEFTVEGQVDDMPKARCCAEPRIAGRPATHDGGPPLHVGLGLGPLVQTVVAPGTAEVGVGILRVRFDSAGVQRPTSSRKCSSTVRAGPSASMVETLRVEIGRPNLEVRRAQLKDELRSIRGPGAHRDRAIQRRGRFTSGPGDRSTIRSCSPGRRCPPGIVRCSRETKPTRPSRRRAQAGPLGNQALRSQVLDLQGTRLPCTPRVDCPATPTG